jgi:sulfotransferase
MLNKVHAITGLPRSGSTLLAALLRQNPRFAAGMSSPMHLLVSAVLERMSREEFSSEFNDDQRRSILRGIFEGYYRGEAGEDSTIFDTHRAWSSKIPLFKTLYPNAKIICCVRDISWIIDSIEMMLRKNPLRTSRLFDFKPGNSIYARVSILMNPENGLIGQAWSALHEAWYGADADRLIFVRYDSLARHPQAVLDRLYTELNEPPFQHDLDSVAYDAPDYDAALGMPGMHTVRTKVEFQPREASIPPDIFKRHADLSFWMKPEHNLRGALVL